MAVEETPPTLQPGVQLKTGEAPATAPTTQAPNPDRPEWLPEKFNTPEEFAKSYHELETKQSQVKPAEGDTKPAEGNPKPAEGTEENWLTPFSQEFDEKGELTEDSYKALEARGINKAIVDEYISNQKTVADMRQTESDKALFDAVGGKTEYDKVAEWAVQTLPEAEIDAFNTALASTPEQAKLAVVGLKAEFDRANPTRPSQTRGPNGQFEPAVKPYTDISQVTADMNSDQYKKDASFRKTVQDRLEKSNVI